MNDKFDKANEFFAHLSGGPVLPVKFYCNFFALISGVSAELKEEKNVPKEIVIFNSRKTDERIISDLAHEYVHAKQFWEGRLKAEGEKEKGNRIAFWNKTQIFKLNPSRSDEEYLNWPWEVEARSLAREWVLQFNRFCRESAQV